MSIEQHFLSQDLTRLNEELLQIHNVSISMIKDAQKGDFENMGQHQTKINLAIKIIQALHNKKLKRNADATAEYINSNYF